MGKAMILFIDISEMPLCLDGTDLAFQDPVITLDIRMGFFGVIFI